MAAGCIAVVLLTTVALMSGGPIKGERKDTESQQPPARPSWRIPAGNPVRGQELAQPCIACHGRTTPQTTPPAPHLRKQRQSYLFFALLAYRDGDRQSEIMAPFAAGLTDQDARDLAVYLSGELPDSPPRARSDLAGYGASVRSCSSCHGETGIGEFEGMPVLTGQDKRYIANALAEYRSGRRSDPTMQAVTRELDPDQDAPLAEYYSAHEWLEALP